MTKYLVTGDGRRLLTGSGMPLTADAPGDAYQDATLEPATLAFNAAPIAATSVVAVALAAATLGFVAAPVQAEIVADENAVQLEPVSLAFDAQPVAASMTLPVGLEPASIAFDAAPIECGATVSVSASPATLGFDAQPITAIITSIITAELAPASFALQCEPVTATRRLGVLLQPASVAFSAQSIDARPVARLRVALQKASFAFNAQPITASQSTAAKFRKFWTDTYGARQTVLNAIDANNRYLAKQAGDKAQATADALVITNTTVTQQGNTITAQGERIEQVSAAVGNKADSSALAALTATVTSQGNTITSQGTAITAVSARVGDIPGNIVKKSDFNDAALGTWINATVNDAPESGWGSQPNTTYRGKYLTTTAGGTYEQSWTACTPGEVYEVSCNGFNTVNATGRFGLHFQNSLGNNIDWLGVADEPLEDQPVAGVWRKIKGSITVPAGAVRMRPWVSPGSGGNNIRITQPVIVKQSATAADTASAVELLDARVEVNEQGIAQTKSTWGVYLTAGNLISGVQSINDGTIAEFNVSAHVFRVMSPSGAPSGMEWQSGYLRSWKENTQVIMGNGFGASNDLMFYAGPNVGVGNATKANAVFWIDSAGVAYFAGQVLQGVLRFFNSTTSTSSSASVETGQNNSNGKPKAISVRYTFDAFQNYPNLTGQITPESGMTSAVIAIERQYSGGSWTELGRRTIVGQVEYEKSDVSFILWTISGSMTVTDADSSTASRSYRARIVSRSQKPFTVTNPGATPAVVLSQYLSVESME